MAEVRRFVYERLAPPSESSDLLSSSSIVYTGHGLLTGAYVYSDGTNDATLTIYDNTAGSGKVVLKIAISGSDLCGGVPLPSAINVYNGIYAAISGTGATAIVHYVEGRHLPSRTRD